MNNINLTDITRRINYLKILSFLVVLWYGIIFNIERIDLFPASIVNLSNYFYIVIVMVGIASLLLPSLEDSDFILTVLLFVCLGQLIRIIIGWPLTSMQIFFVEMALISATLWMVRFLASNLQVIEHGMDAIILNDETSHVLSYEEAEKQINWEMHSLKKLRRPMTMIYCRLASDDANFVNLATIDEILNWNINQLYKFRTRQVELGRRVMDLTYYGDIVFEYQNGIVVCLIEVDEEEAKNFVYRIHQYVKRFEELTLWTGIAVFPEEGTTFKTLLNYATNNITYYEKDSDETLDNTTITGDFRVSLRERLEIEIKASWVNNLAYQSHTSRAIYRPLKRLIDIVGASMAILILSPLYLIVAFLIIINDGFPVFYRQSRVGLGGQYFDMLKFRSMYRNVPALQPVIVELPDGTIREDWPDKVENDPRVTPIGRYIRKWSIDELPQLWNVLKGDMSLIGPRPSSWPLEKHTLHQTARLTVKPGITGLWQVSARDSKNFDARLLWDLKYVQKMSFVLDVFIVLRTFGAVIRKTGV